MTKAPKVLAKTGKVLGKTSKALGKTSKATTEEKIHDSTAEFEQALLEPAAEYILRLYIAGSSPKSLQAIANVKRICEQNLLGHYELQVIDLYQQPQLAQGEQILAAPTLIKKLPQPLRRVIGDMSSAERVLVGLDLRKPIKE